MDRRVIIAAGHGGTDITTPDASVGALVGAAARGCDRAWSALVDRFDATIRAIAARHRLASDDRDEVAQRTWLRLVLNVDKVKDPNALAGWLATTARRQALDVIAERSREVAVAEPRDAGTDDAASVAEQVIASERRDALRSAVERVPAHERGLVRLLLDEPALSYDELSAALDMPRGSIGPTRARCLARLRDDRHLAGVAGPGSTRLPVAHAAAPRSLSAAPRTSTVNRLHVRWPGDRLAPSPEWSRS